MLRAIAIDENPSRNSEEYCLQSEFISLKKRLQSEEVQSTFRSFPVDLLFLDIQMPKLSGIEFTNPGTKCNVNFSPQHTVGILDGFNMNAVDYLAQTFFI